MRGGWGWSVAAGLAWVGGCGWWSADWAPPPDASDAPAEVVRKPPNVLVVVWDTTRADRLSVYGYERPTTPFLERFASEARVWDQARSPAIWTLPAHASLFTGLPPTSTGADERWLWLDGTHLTLAEHLGANGYATFSFAANALLSTDTNLVQGFDTSLNTWHGRVRTAAAAMTRRKVLPRDRSNELAPGYTPPPHGATNAEWARAIYKDAAPLVTEGLLRWVDQQPAEAPWFAYLNFMEAHTPRIPSVESRKAMMDEATHELALATDASHIALHFYNFGKTDYTAAELRAINAVYDATLRDLDRATEALVAGLEARGVLDDTVVVITSDHGENLGDHHLFNHRFALWDSLLHVPLIVRHPSTFAPGRVPHPVSTTDLFATVCGAAGVPVPEAVRPFSADLRSRGPSDPVFATMALPLEREVQTVAAVHPDVSLAPWIRSGATVVSGDEKWTRYSLGEPERFRWSDDPGELLDRAGEDPSGDRALGGMLQAWEQSVPRYDPSRRGAGDDPKSVRASQEDLRRQLEALGYVQED